MFGDKLGVAASLNYQDLRIQAHNNETGGWGFNDDLGAFVPDDDYEQRFYDLTRERIGMVVNIDYRMTENTELYLRTLYNQYKDDETRNKWEIRSLDEEDPSLTGTGYAFDYAESDAEARVREEVRNIQTYAVGGQTFAGNWAFDYEISYAYAEENDSNNHDVTFRSDDMEGSGILLWDNSNPKKPVFSGPGFDFLLDPANYEMDSYEREFTINEDTEWSYKFDVTNDTVLGDTPVTWKFGMKLRDREKVRDENLMIYERDDVLLTDYITDNARISGWRMGNPMFQWPSGELTNGAFASSSSASYAAFASA